MLKLPRFRFSLRTILVLVAVAAAVFAGVATLLRTPGRPYSRAFAGFDPLALLASRAGYAVQGVAGNGTFNVPAGYAYKEWRGIVAAPGDPSVRATIQNVLQEYLEKVSEGRYHAEGRLAGDPDETPHHAQLPSHALFMFNEREWHGDMHVWLFPDTSGSVGYAIFLREQRLE